MTRTLKGKFLHTTKLYEAGLSIDNLKSAITYTHNILDEIDGKLLSVGADRLSETVELANLSSMIGNLLGAGIATNSDKKFIRNGPHKYPDILSNSENVRDIEIKISLETNKPKGHLAKEGFYLTCRYVLIEENGTLNIENRGKIAEIWEARFGYLKESHFNISNTPGDSGKTAVINQNGMEELEVVYININICPYSHKSPTFKSYQKLINSI